MVALRGGADIGVWTSFDGLAWLRLAVTGDLPSDHATQAVLLPDGVLLSDATESWFGQATTGYGPTTGKATIQLSTRPATVLGATQPAESRLGTITP